MSSTSSTRRTRSRTTSPKKLQRETSALLLSRRARLLLSRGACSNGHGFWHNVVHRACGRRGSDFGTSRRRGTVAQRLSGYPIAQQNHISPLICIATCRRKFSFRVCQNRTSVRLVPVAQSSCSIAESRHAAKDSRPEGAQEGPPGGDQDAANSHPSHEHHHEGAEVLRVPKSWPIVVGLAGPFEGL